MSIVLMVSSPIKTADINRLSLLRRWLLTTFLFTCAGNLLSCSSSEDTAAFDLVSAQQRWNKTENTSEKNWSNSELNSLEQGRVLYAKNCSACHGREGKGNSTIGAPALVNNAIVRGNIRYHVSIINKGGSVMPAYAQILTPAEIYNVAAYERNAWGNHDYPVFKNNPD